MAQRTPSILAVAFLCSCTVVTDRPDFDPPPSLDPTDGEYPLESTGLIDPFFDASTSSVDSSGDGGEVEDESSGGAPAVCGDGVVAGAEECDGGGGVPTATCDADCTHAVCGDGAVNAAAGEACDTGGESPTCNADCSLAACGDGVVNAAAGEACDTGGVDTVLCDSDCSLPVCGDGYLNPAVEECDSPVPSDGCHPATCEFCPISSTLFTFDVPPPWSFGPGWESGVATASNGHTPSCGGGDPAVDADGVPSGGVAGVVIGGNAPLMQGLAVMTTQSSSVINASYVELRFDSWQNVQDPEYQHFVEVLTPAGWHELWSSGPADQPHDVAWHANSFDITSLIGNTVTARFGYEANSPTVLCSGWNIDNVEVFTFTCGL